MTAKIFTSNAITNDVCSIGSNYNAQTYCVLLLNVLRSLYAIMLRHVNVRNCLTNSVRIHAHVVSFTLTLYVSCPLVGYCVE